MRFKWESLKASKNLRKHKVSFNEASSIFFDPLSATFDDPDHSYGEQRFITIGKSISNKILVVAHKDEEDSIRIISARVATAHERNQYENK